MTIRWVNRVYVSQGSKGGAVVRAFASHQCGPGSNPGLDMWVEFVVGSLPCSETFFSGYSGFPLFSKTNTSKFQFDLERTDTEKRALKLLGASWVNKLHFLNYIYPNFLLTKSGQVRKFNFFFYWLDREGMTWVLSSVRAMACSLCKVLSFVQINIFTSSSE